MALEIAELEQGAKKARRAVDGLDGLPPALYDFVHQTPVSRIRKQT